MCLAKAQKQKAIDREGRRRERTFGWRGEGKSCSRASNINGSGTRHPLETWRYSSLIPLHEIIGKKSRENKRVGKKKVARNEERGSEQDCKPKHYRN